jgi:hypothetical protein
MMPLTLVLTIVWTASNLYCFYLCKKHWLRFNFLVSFIGLIVGPFAIPFILAKARKPSATAL